MDVNLPFGGSTTLIFNVGFKHIVEFKILGLLKFLKTKEPNSGELQ